MKKRQPSWILFDCMETLVDFEPVPQAMDYARWSFHRSGVEHFWSGYDEFFGLFSEASHFLTQARPDHQEWSTLERFLHICQNTSSIPANLVEATAGRLEKQFFETYLAQCFVRPDVVEVIPVLSRKIHLGVVSNFKVKQGVEHILEHNRLRHHFKWVLTSVETGWRKPHVSIYQESITLTGVNAEDILFIGDDPLNDSLTPISVGMDALLLDRKNTHHSVIGCDCIHSFLELREFIAF